MMKMERYRGEMDISVDARLVPRADVAAREINDGAVLVNMGSGACFELNRVGFEIWKALGPGATVGAICQSLGGRYAIAPEVLAADVRSLAEALAGAGLVDVT
jgi:Coenzyme PQQ synthesis protein D (PqqD)